MTQVAQLGNADAVAARDASEIFDCAVRAAWDTSVNAGSPASLSNLEKPAGSAALMLLFCEARSFAKPEASRPCAACCLPSNPRTAGASIPISEELGP